VPGDQHAVWTNGHTDENEHAWRADADGDTDPEQNADTDENANPDPYSYPYSDAERAYGHTNPDAASRRV
jgi:hypothetical protein